VAVLEQIPDDEDVQHQDDEDRQHGMARELVNLNRHKEGRLADGQPAGPTDAEHQPHALHEREQAVENRSAGQPDHF
jgi:hypothetical protein